MTEHFEPKRWAGQWRAAARLTAMVCFAVAGYLVLAPPRDRQPAASEPAGVGSAAVESLALHRASLPGENRSHATRPIETIRVGHRVLASNPEVGDPERAGWAEPAWEECLHLSLQMPLRSHVDGEEPAVLQIELLRPESWIQDRLALVIDLGDATATPATLQSGTVDSVGIAASMGDEKDRALVALSPLRPLYRNLALAAGALSAEGGELLGLTLELDLPEMGASGTAVITGLRPGPVVKAGDGQVVTATFAHPPSHQVLDVRFEGEPEPIGVTENHLFWSADHQRFMAIGEMELGERVRTYHGDTKRIVSKLARPGPQTVYNLEVYGEHVYFVGQQGVLAHNAYSTAPNNAARRPGGYRTGDTDSHGVLSPGANRAPGHTNTRADGFVQSHHGVQRQWAKRNIDGYDETAAPAVLLKSRSGEVHAKISAAQRVRRRQPGGWDTEIRTEFNLSYREMIDAGHSPREAQRVMKQNYKYFDSIGAFD